MTIKDQQPGGPAYAPHDHQDYGSQGQAPRQSGQPAPRPRAATGLAAGSQMFSRMPAYTPVTRAPEQPYPQDTGYETQPPAPEGYGYDETAQGGAYQGQAYSEHGYEEQGYAEQPAYAPEQPQYDEQPAYQEPAQYTDQNGYAADAYAEQPYGEAAYQPGQEYGQPAQAGEYQSDAYQQDPSFGEEEPLDLGMEEPDAYAEQPQVEQSFEAYDDQGQYAEQPAQQSYDEYAPAEGAYANGYGAEQGQPQADYAGYNGQDYGQAGYDEAAYDPNAAPAEMYGEAQYPQGDYAAQNSGHESGQAVQAYEAAYDQAPEIPLGYSDPAQAQQYGDAQYGEAQYADAQSQSDADFMGEAESDGVKAGILSRYMGRRSTMMVASAVVGAIALGGALAFAYKQTGGGLSGEPPLITAENTPVKEAPESPGGREFPHKNKLIYDRLENGDQPEADRLMPRQEELALPNMPAQTDMPNMPELASAEGAGQASDPDSGPRKVKTLTVRPDGSVDSAAAAETGAAAEPTTTASIEPQSPPEAGAQPAVNQKFGVQLAARRQAADAFAAFPDLQRKYSSLLGSYRPTIDPVNLDSGSWYRLLVGPLEGNAAASKLCSDLKAQGLSDCVVRSWSE